MIVKEESTFCVCSSFLSGSLDAAAKAARVITVGCKSKRVRWASERTRSLGWLRSALRFVHRSVFFLRPPALVYTRALFQLAYLTFLSFFYFFSLFGTQPSFPRSSSPTLGPTFFHPGSLE